MRVERPFPPRNQQSTSTRDDTPLTATYDLCRHVAKCGGGSGGRGGGGEGRKSSGQRMPRDVKERMKALPRFIDILRRMPPVAKDVYGGGRGGK